MQRVQVSIAEGACDGNGQSIYEATLEREQSANVEPPSTLAAGPYAFHAQAFDNQGIEIAQACREVKLPRADGIVIELDAAGECLDNTDSPDAGTALDGSPASLDDGGTADSASPNPDHCPQDPAKTEPGTCGCGMPETDSDNDSTPDCTDGCPNNAAKTVGGVCGCATADTDGDGDGTLDCNDMCPMDSSKISPGTCGCGTREPFDQPGFISSKGESCSDWIGYKCTEADTKWGYTKAEEATILANCSLSCKVCPPPG